MAPGSKTPNAAATSAPGTSPSGAPRPVTYPTKKSSSPRPARASLTGSDHTACMAIGSSASRSRRAGVGATSGGCAPSGPGAKKNSTAAA